MCADRIYTIAGNDREDMVRWATVLTLVVRTTLYLFLSITYERED